MKEANKKMVMVLIVLVLLIIIIVFSSLNYQIITNLLSKKENKLLVLPKNESNWVSQQDIQLNKRALSNSVRYIAKMGENSISREGGRVYDTKTTKYPVTAMAISNDENYVYYTSRYVGTTTTIPFETKAIYRYYLDSESEEPKPLGTNREFNFDIDKNYFITSFAVSDSSRYPGAFVTNEGFLYLYVNKNDGLGNILYLVKNGMGDGIIIGPNTNDFVQKVVMNNNYIYVLEESYTTSLISFASLTDPNLDLTNFSNWKTLDSDVFPSYEVQSLALGQRFGAGIYKGDKRYIIFWDHTNKTTGYLDMMYPILKVELGRNNMRVYYLNGDLKTDFDLSGSQSLAEILRGIQAKIVARGVIPSSFLSDTNTIFAVPTLQNPECDRIKDTYNVIPYQSWGNLTETSLQQYWIDNQCFV